MFLVFIYSAHFLFIFKIFKSNQMAVKLDIIFLQGVTVRKISRKKNSLKWINNKIWVVFLSLYNKLDR